MRSLLFSIIVDILLVGAQGRAQEEPIAPQCTFKFAPELVTYKVSIRNEEGEVLFKKSIEDDLKLSIPLKAGNYSIALAPGLFASVDEETYFTKSFTIRQSEDYSDTISINKASFIFYPYFDKQTPVWASLVSTSNVKGCPPLKRWIHLEKHPESNRKYGGFNSVEPAVYKLTFYKGDELPSQKTEIASFLVDLHSIGPDQLIEFRASVEVQIQTKSKK